jgi:hypothetical protein
MVVESLDLSFYTRHTIDKVDIQVIRLRLRRIAVPGGLWQWGYRMLSMRHYSSYVTWLRASAIVPVSDPTMFCLFLTLFPWS